MEYGELSLREWNVFFGDEEECDPDAVDAAGAGGPLRFAGLPGVFAAVVFGRKSGIRSHYGAIFFRFDHDDQQQGSPGIRHYSYG